jgi:hypothetical protein
MGSNLNSIKHHTHTRHYFARTEAKLDEALAVLAKEKEDEKKLFRSVGCTRRMTKNRVYQRARKIKKDAWAKEREKLATTSLGDLIK